MNTCTISISNSTKLQLPVTPTLVHVLNIYTVKTEETMSLTVKISAIGIVTHYESDGPGIDSPWGARFSAPLLPGP